MLNLKLIKLQLFGSPASPSLLILAGTQETVLQPISERLHPKQQHYSVAITIAGRICFAHAVVHAV